LLTLWRLIDNATQPKPHLTKSGLTAADRDPRARTVGTIVAASAAVPRPPPPAAPPAGGGSCSCVCPPGRGFGACYQVRVMLLLLLALLVG